MNNYHCSNESKPREQHIAEFWHSYYASIQACGGNIGFLKPGPELVKIAGILAQNGIRFMYKRD